MKTVPTRGRWKVGVEPVKGLARIGSHWNSSLILPPEPEVKLPELGRKMLAGRLMID
jgi:hypothetical protein